MSRDFHLRCAVCVGACWGRGADLNWQGDQLLALIPHFPLFVQVSEAGFDIDPQSTDLNGSYLPDRLAGFARKHVGHEIQVWDEYGERWTGENE